MNGRYSSFIAFAFFLMLAAGTSRPASAQNNFIGELRLFPYNFVPQGWAACDGQLLVISQNQALFALIGTIYGGNGTTDFALPDLRGRVPVSVGQGPGLSNYDLGEQFGEETHTLTAAEMPAHSHALNVSTNVGTSDSPVSNVPARNAAAVPQYAATPNGTAAPNAIANAGGGQPHENRPPSLVLHWCIALQGLFPPHP